MVVERRCLDCGQTFLVTPDERVFLEAVSRQNGRPFVMPSRCVACRKHRRAARLAMPPDVAERWHDLTCVDCRQTFQIGPRDVAYYLGHGYAWPKRCRACRAEQKAHEGATR